MRVTRKVWHPDWVMMPGLVAEADGHHDGIVTSNLLVAPFPESKQHMHLRGRGREVADPHHPT